MIVSLAFQPAEELRLLWNRASKETATSRGGSELLLTIRADADDVELLDYLARVGCVWVASKGGAPEGFAIYRNRVIEAIYVDRDHRRQGVAGAIFAALQSLEPPPLDSLVLPGDRATKSLYESFGWKARLLTMRGD